MHANQGSYRFESVIRGNTLVDNGGSIFTLAELNRYCSDGSDGVCTLVDGRSSSRSPCPRARQISHRPR